MSGGKVVRGKRCVTKGEGGKDECGKCGVKGAQLEEMRLMMEEMRKELVELKGEMKFLHEAVRVAREEWEGCRKQLDGGSEEKSGEVEKIEKAWKVVCEKKEEEFRISLRSIMEEEERLVAESRKEGVMRNDGNITFSKREVRMEVAEELEKERRRNRLVLMGIPEVGEDGGGKDMVDEVMKGLLYGEKVQFQVLGRIGRKGVKARPIRIMMEEREQKRKILSRAKQLRQIRGLERVFVMPDLTRAQQEEEYKIRIGRWRAGGEGVAFGRGRLGCLGRMGKLEQLIWK